MLASYPANILNQKQARAGIPKNESETKYQALKSYPALRGKTRVLTEIYLARAPGLSGFFASSGIVAAARG